MNLEPSIRATFIHRLADGSTVTRRWSTRPLADAGAFSEGRVYRFEPVERRMTQPDGSYTAATGRIELSDKDGLFRGLMAGPSTQYVTGSELTIELLSDAGRAAGTPWRPIIRGRVTDIQCPPGRRAVIEVTDVLGAQVSGYDLDKTIGIPMTRAMFPTLPPGNDGRILPIIASGEWSDLGKVDAQGRAVDKGLLPALDAGDRLINPSGESAPAGTAVGYMSPPRNFTAEIVGAAGSRSYLYEVSAVNLFGETDPWWASQGETTTVTIQVTNAPNVLTETNYVRLTWDPPDNGVPIAYRLYRDGMRIDRIPHEGDTIATEWHDNGWQQPRNNAIYPHTNTAQLDTVVNGETFAGWGFLVAKQGALAELQDVYASDLSEGAVPKRVRMPESVYGTEFLAPGRPGWPHPNPWIEVPGPDGSTIRVGGFYARGPRLEHHRSGRVTIAWNGCADEDEGDATGATFTEAFYAWQHVMNDYGFADGGKGYRTGTWPGLETFVDGTPIIKTSAVQACQALTVGWIGGRGYQAHIAIYAPITLREFDRVFRQTFRSETGNNHYGQIYPALIPDAATPNTGRVYRDRVNVAMMTGQEFRHSQVVTRVIFHFDPDPDGNRMVQTDLVLEDTLATASHGGRAREQGPVTCRYTRDAATVWDAQARHIARYKVAPRTPAIRSDLGAVHDEIGTQVRATLHDGAGGAAGDHETSFFVIGQAVDPSTPGAEACTLQLFDLERISSLAFPLLEDEDEMAIGNLYDEDVDAPPPDGAYELR